MLTRYDSNRLENIQKNCLRTIFGFDKNYEELLKASGLETLENRREKALKKFAAKAVKNPQFSAWSPLNKNRASLRTGKIYEERLAKSDRLYNSPLFKMRRILNDSDHENRQNNPVYLDLSDLFNQT